MPHVVVPQSPTEARALLAADGLPVLVDFTAAWCGPCQAFAPVLESLAAQRAGKLVVVKVDVDEHRELAALAGIRSVPTLLVVRNGQTVAAKSGAMRLGELEAFVDRWVG